MAQKMTHDKLLTRVRNLLDMAGDASSPNEAAIAARRARALIDKHQLTDLDLQKPEANLFGESSMTFAQAKSPKWLGRIAVQIAYLNDCNVKLKIQHGFAFYYFEGFLTDTETSKYMLIYLNVICDRICKDQKIKRAQSTSFRLGFAAGIRDQVTLILAERKQIKTSNGTSLVIAKKSLVESHFGKMQVGRSRTNAADSAAYAAGHEAGKSTSLNRQVGQAQRRLT